MIDVGTTEYLPSQQSVAASEIDIRTQVIVTFSRRLTSIAQTNVHYLSFIGIDPRPSQPGLSSESLSCHNLIRRWKGIDCSEEQHPNTISLRTARRGRQVTVDPHG